MYMINKESINISYLNLRSSPSLELNLAFSEKIHIDSKEISIFFLCDKALKSCSVNVLNKKSVCNICTYKAKKGFKEFKRETQDQS